MVVVSVDRDIRGTQKNTPDMAEAKIVGSFLL
jgi:hypothetical protein